MTGLKTTWRNIHKPKHTTKRTLYILAVSICVAILIASFDSLIDMVVRMAMS